MNNINWNNNGVFGNGLNRQEYLNQLSDSPEQELGKKPVSTLSDFQVSSPVSPMKTEPPKVETRDLEAYLKERIGQRVQAEFILGAVQCAVKMGRIKEVGRGFFVLEMENGTVLCDLGSVKFITFVKEA